jgi:hypothetical protein
VPELIDDGRPIPPLTLFGTSACHLCELAEEMLQALRAESPELAYAKLDISESDELFALYGLRIPVLRDAAGRELGWPFSSSELRAFCGAP